MITRAAAKLRPASEVTRIAHHPGVVVHCTGGSRVESTDEAMKAWRAAQAWHMRGCGWADIGYHFGVAPDGTVLEGRGWKVLGAHAGRGYNKHLGVVVFGHGVDITDEERSSIQALVAEHVARGGLEVVLPHNAIARKRCPGPAVTAWVRERWPGRVV